MFERTKALCDSFLEMGIPGLDLMVCRDGQCVLRYTRGYSDRENRIPMKGDELLNIFSCSKPITVTAAMQLWEKGLFRLDDPVADYLPEFAHPTVQTEDGVRPARNPILIRNLFQMTAGLSYLLRSPSLLRAREETGGRCPTREVIRALAGEPLRFDPGADYLYGLSHDVLAALVEVLSGQLFQDYVKEHIFDPLGMTRSDFLLPMEDYEKVSPLYYRDAAADRIILHPNGKVPIYRLGAEYASGGAGCVSTVEDYMKFLEALRTGETLLKRDTLRVMTSARLTPEQWRSFPYKTHTYGLGLRVPREGGRHTDFGWGGAAGAFLAVDIPHGISLYYAQHVTQSPNMPLRMKIYESVIEDLTGIRLSGETHPAPGADNLTY